MSDCTQDVFRFPSPNRRKLEVSFNGQNITSNGGLLLIREADRLLGLTEKISKTIPDPRKPEMIVHSQVNLLRQRIYGLAAGYEDLNDHDELRFDPAFQVSLKTDQELASSPTLCRLEKRADRKTAFKIHKIMVDTFIRSYKTPPEELILDFDGTDDAVHGNQKGKYYNGFYGHHCFLPLYVFCGEQLLVSYLRPGNSGAATHAWAILSLLVKRFRRKWPDARIIFRADGGFFKPRIFSWCEKNNVDFIVGAPKNSRLLDLSHDLLVEAKKQYEATGEKQRIFSEINYSAARWRKKVRRIIVKAEHTDQGGNPRYVITSLKGGDPQYIYDDIYCQRGDSENRIKENKLDLFSGRTSCTGWWSNQFRLLLSGAAYILLSSVRRIALAGTEMAHAQCVTIRHRLIRIGGVVVRNTRRIRFMLSSSHPWKNIFFHSAKKLCAG